MAHINNVFVGITSFFINIGLVYLFHPNVVSLTTELPDEVAVFAYVVWIVFAILLVLGFPFMLATSSASDVP